MVRQQQLVFCVVAAAAVIAVANAKKGLLNDECLPECGGSITNCFIDPCDPRSNPGPCAAQANLTCVSDYCDGCTARYYDDNCAEVTCSAVFNAAECLPECDGNIVNCFADPCQVDTSPCASAEGLTCVADFCGGCHARYYSDEGCVEAQCAE